MEKISPKNTHKSTSSSESKLNLVEDDEITIVFLSRSDSRESSLNFVSEVPRNSKLITQNISSSRSPKHASNSNPEKSGLYCAVIINPTPYSRDYCFN